MRAGASSRACKPGQTVRSSFAPAPCKMPPPRQTRCTPTFPCGEGQGEGACSSRDLKLCKTALLVRSNPGYAGVMANAAAQIMVRGVAKRYGALEVFRGIDFTVGEREIVAIVGPSGCGKTTLLRCIDGLMNVDAGEIVVNGERVTSPIPGVAMVFQHFGLFPWKTVYGNVAYGLRMAGVGKPELARRVPAFINMVGLGGFERAYPYQMSGGMQQRCG
ncbi:MAG: ATP-binding cassette domain-containing protein, partial [Alphaproteobacteria bacterium]